MNMLVSVRKRVTESITRPGMSETGISKLIPEISTMVAVGTYDFKHANNCRKLTMLA